MLDKWVLRRKFEGFRKYLNARHNVELVCDGEVCGLSDQFAHSLNKSR